MHYFEYLMCAWIDCRYGKRLDHEDDTVGGSYMVEIPRNADKAIEFSPADFAGNGGWTTSRPSDYVFNTCTHHRIEHDPLPCRATLARLEPLNG
jgi:hypothetical protein